MSVEAAVAAVLSVLDSICTVKGEQRTAPKAILGGQDCPAFLPTGFAVMVHSS